MMLIKFAISIKSYLLINRNCTGMCFIDELND